MYNARMMFADAARAGAPKDEPEKVWAALGGYVDECLRMGKGLKVPKLGSFSAVKTNPRTDPGNALRTQPRRVFHVANHFSRAYGVVPRKHGYELTAPCLEFNASKLAYKVKARGQLSARRIEGRINVERHEMSIISAALARACIGERAGAQGNADTFVSPCSLPPRASLLNHTALS